MNTQELANYLSLSVDRIEAIAADLGIAVTEGFVFSDEQVEQVEAVALYMAEHELTDPAVAIAALRAQNPVTLAVLAVQFGCPLVLLVGIAESLNLNPHGALTPEQCADINRIYQYLLSQDLKKPSDGMTIAQLADQLDVSVERVEAIAEELQFPTNGIEYDADQVGQIVAVAQFMVEQGFTDAADAIASMNEAEEQQNFGVHADQAADQQLAAIDAANRFVGFQVTSNGVFAMMISQGINPECLTAAQREALEQSAQFASDMINQRLNGTQDFLKQLATRSEQFQTSNAIAPQKLRSLASAKPL